MELTSDSLAEKEVGKITALLYAMIALAIFSRVLTIFEHISVRSPWPTIWTGVVVIALFWFFIKMLEQRRAWVRPAFLIIFVVSVPLSVLPAFDGIIHSYVQAAIMLVHIILFCLAIKKMYSAEVSSWLQGV